MYQTTHVFPKSLFTTYTCIISRIADGSEIKVHVAGFLASGWHLIRTFEYSLHVCYITAILRILSLKKFCLFIRGHENMFWNELNLGTKENMPSTVNMEFNILKKKNSHDYHLWFKKCPKASKELSTIKLKKASGITNCNLCKMLYICRDESPVTFISHLWQTCYNVGELYQQQVSSLRTSRAHQTHMYLAV